MVRTTCLIRQFLADINWQPDRQDSVLVAIVVEDIGKARRDNASNPLVQQSPGRVLTRGSATEIFTRDQDARFRIFRTVQNEISFWRSIGQRFQLVKQAFRQARAFRRLQKLLWNNHVSVDIGHRLALFEQRRSRSGKLGKCFHERLPSVKNER